MKQRTGLIAAAGTMAVSLALLAAAIGFPAALAAEKRLKVTQTVQKAKCKNCAPPEYPALARSTRVQGIVTLYAVIDKEGKVSEVRLVSGHPLLARAAQDAVKQWRYSPTVSDGAPVEVETEVTVRFDLSK